MAQRRKAGQRVLGPYRSRGEQWFVVLVDGSTSVRSSLYFQSEGEARKNAEDLRREIAALSAVDVDEAIEEYATYQQAKGNKQRLIAHTSYHLRSFFIERDLAVSMLDVKRCAAYYQRTTEKLAVDSHRNRLVEAKTFLRWCVKRGYLKASPLDAVEGVGRRRKHGKAQLRVDEARRWMEFAMRLVSKRDSGAVAAVMTLLLGLRASEIIQRVGRDVDDDGRLLWISSSKTEAGRRTLQVPEMLRPHLLRLAKKAGPEGLLFGRHWRDWPRLQVQRICELTNVPTVSAHGMRGTHASLAVEAGGSGHLVASALGHESFTTTVESYAKPGAVGSARQRNALRVLAGGKK